MWWRRLFDVGGKVSFSGPSDRRTSNWHRWVSFQLSCPWCGGCTGTLQFMTECPQTLWHPCPAVLHNAGVLQIHWARWKPSSFRYHKVNYCSRILWQRVSLSRHHKLLDPVQQPQCAWGCVSACLWHQCGTTSDHSWDWWSVWHRLTEYSYICIWWLNDDPCVTVWCMLGMQQQPGICLLWSDLRAATSSQCPVRTTTARSPSLNPRQRPAADLVAGSLWPQSTSSLPGTVWG